MLNPELFLAFAAATAALILIPGPVVSLVVANAIAHGARTGLATVAGASAGTAVLIAGGAIGLTTMLAFLSDIFVWVRWAGVAYLAYLGLKHWRAMIRAVRAEEPATAPAARGVFWQGALIGVTNPKTVLFYVAFFPQFLDPALPVGPQLAVMSAAFLIIGLIFDGSYALLSGRIRPWLVGVKRNRIRNGITGTLLIGTSIGLALSRRE